MRIAALTLFVLTLIAIPTFTFAEDKPATQPSADAETPTLIQASDKDAITANMDKDVVIEGVIEKAEWSGSGKVMKADFKDAAASKLATVIFVKSREKFDAAYGGDVTKALTGAKVRVKGKLKDFKGSPEIVLDQPNQITIVDAATSQPAK